MLEWEPTFVGLLGMCWDSPHRLSRLYRYLYQKLLIGVCSRLGGKGLKIASALFDPDKSILFSRPPSDEDLYFYGCLIRQLMLSNPPFCELEAFATTCLSHTSTCYCHVLCRIFKYYEQQERRFAVSESTIRTFLSTHGLCCRERRYFYKLLPYLARTTSVLEVCDFAPTDPYHLVSLFRCALEGEDLRYVRTVMGPDASLSPSEVLDLVDENDKHVLSVLDCMSTLVLQDSQLPPQICYEFVADFIRRMEGDVSIILCFLEDSVEILNVILNVCKILERDSQNPSSREREQILRFFRILEEECAEMEKAKAFSFSLLPVIRRLRFMRSFFESGQRQ